MYAKELVNNNSTQQETLALIDRMRSGDDNARELLIKNYLRLVLKIARSYMNKGVPLADLVSEGNFGLMTAIEKYDPVKGVFSSHAQIWIRQSILRNCMMKQSLIRLPENRLHDMMADRWKGPAHREISIDTPNDEGDTMADDIAELPDSTYIPFQNEESFILKNKIERILAFLPGRDAEIVKACYGIDREKPLEVVETAELFQLSTTRINQILRNSLKKMRITHNKLPESKEKEVEIVNAKYGIDGNSFDVTDKVTDLYLDKENIKATNRLGGDPCPGVAKILTIQYIYNDTLLTKSFSEGSVVKF